MGISMSLEDGSLNLSNSWTRQLSETANGNVCCFSPNQVMFYILVSRLLICAQMVPEDIKLTHHLDFKFLITESAACIAS